MLSQPNNLARTRVFLAAASIIRAWQREFAHRSWRPFCATIFALSAVAIGCGGSDQTGQSSSLGGSSAAGPSSGGATGTAGSAGVVTSRASGGAGIGGNSAVVGGGTTSPASGGGAGGTSPSTGGAPSTGGVGHGGVNGTSGVIQGGVTSAGGSNPVGGTGASNTGGAAQGSSVGGAVVTGGTLSAGGRPSTGGTVAGTGGAGGVSGGGALIQAYDGARGKSFNDGWKFYLGNASGAEQPTFNDTSWRSLSVPHDWSIELSFNKNSLSGNGGGLLDGGIGWYRKTFTLDPSYSGQQIRVEFDGVYMNSQVWINGTSLGTRPYGYSTFQYDLTKYVKTDGSNNVIAVKVDNSSQPNSRWYSGSGIYRNVWLTALNPVHVAYNGGFITTPSVSATSATVSSATDVENQASSSQSVTITMGIYDASGAMVANNTTAASSVAAGATSTLNQSLTVSNPHLWSTDAPYLYQVKLTLQVGNSTVDTYVVPLGLRYFSFDSSKGFSLNGQSMKLWGMCMHHDLGAIGAAYHCRALERQLQILKGMGMNAIRTSHNPPVPELLERRRRSAGEWWHLERWRRRCQRGRHEYDRREQQPRHGG